MMWKLFASAIWVLLLAALVACGRPEPDVIHGPVIKPSSPTATAVASPKPTVSPTPIAVPAPTIGAVPTPSPVDTESPSPTLTPSPASTPTPGPMPTVGPTPVAVPVTSLIVDLTLVPDSFIVVAPQTLRAGYTEQASVSLFSGAEPAAGTVRLALYRGDAEVSSASGRVEGVGNVDLPVPQEAGSYSLEVMVDGVEEREWAPVDVQKDLLLLVETDKPIYKPGQTVHIRVMTLDVGLKPRPSSTAIEVQDAKGIKVFKKDVDTDGYGMATVDLPLSTEPNLGVWKLTAFSGDQRTQLDVRVEEYVLPKYEVSVTTERDWVLPNEPIKGTVKGEYSFGKPVLGEVEIVALRYVGVWEEYARFTANLNDRGEAAFELPPVDYVAGVPQAGGQGNVTLEVTVGEKSTGYEESTTQLFTVAAAPVVLKVIPESNVFKPGLEMGYLVAAQTPGGQPVDTEVELRFSYLNEEFDESATETLRVATSNGKALVKTSPPSDAIFLDVLADANPGFTTLTLRAGHSPSGHFIHLEQVTEGDIEVGDAIHFRVNSTQEARNFYYEVLSRGAVLFTDVSSGADIRFPASHMMAPSSRLLVYQILPSNEIAADYLPFSVQASYPHQVEVGFNEEEVRPGSAVDIDIQTQGESRVGLVAVDKSVFILAENRLNLQQVFNELEKLYLEPQVELHEASFIDPWFGGEIGTRGASETFEEAGVVVLSNKEVPSGEEFQGPLAMVEAAPVAEEARAAPAPAPAAVAPDGATAQGGLAEVQRVRQFFPETWLWQDVTTDASGSASVAVEAPDSITTWMLRAVGMSKEHGLGIGEDQLRVFQPFFLTVDLPYSAIRGEELPVKVALFNYLETPQEIFVEIEDSADFDLLDDRVKSVSVDASDIGGTEFKIRLNQLGAVPIKITARSAEAADAVIKELLVEPEGVPVEEVSNLVLSAGDSHVFDLRQPKGATVGSERAYVALTGSLMTQTIEGLEGLLQMPFGCGEQNMILFAPNVFVARYLRETGQLKPEVMAKAEHLMLVGYQRELTYQRHDGSFSAFGDSDEEGSLWLTAFVLKTFAEARELMYIDPAVLAASSNWIEKHQQSDGSFENVGFLHHQELLGGLQGKDALTAYVAIALLEAGSQAAADKAMAYLEGRLNGMNDPYTLAITAYAMELAASSSRDDAHNKLMELAQSDDGALYWGGVPSQFLPKTAPGHHYTSAVIETTGYALLSLVERGDLVNAGRAAKWLAGQRNAYGGFGSTQDTVVGLQALTAFATKSRSDVDATIALESGDWRKEVRINAANADVLQTFEVPPLDLPVTVTSDGMGDVVLQSVLRYSVPDTGTDVQPVFDISVDYGTEDVAVDDLINVVTLIQFNPTEPVKAGMVVLDVAVPTGFEPVRATIQSLVEENANLKRFEIAGRKVILYIMDMSPGEQLRFTFQAKAKYPVRAKEVVSQVYSYYKPEQRGEALGGAIVVAE